jgi:hypothetical protein
MRAVNATLCYNNNMSDIETIQRLRRKAKLLRAGANDTSLMLADCCDQTADLIEAGEIVGGEEVGEEESLEQLMAEFEVTKRIGEVLARHDAGSLVTLLKRCGKTSE